MNGIAEAIYQLRQELQKQSLNPEVTIKFASREDRDRVVEILTRDLVFYVFSVETIETPKFAGVRLTF